MYKDLRNKFLEYFESYLLGKMLLCWVIHSKKAFVRGSSTWMGTVSLCNRYETELQNQKLRRQRAFLWTSVDLLSSARINGEKVHLGFLPNCLHLFYIFTLNAQFYLKINDWCADQTHCFLILAWLWGHLAYQRKMQVCSASSWGSNTAWMDGNQTLSRGRGQPSSVSRPWELAGMEELFPANFGC